MSREKSIKVRVSGYEYEQLKLEADRQGVPMSDLIRKYISTLPNPKS
jgi:predicted DNA binding CopG/RHH family protein